MPINIAKIVGRLAVDDQKRVPPEVFISYSTKNRTQKEQLKEYLNCHALGRAFQIWDDDEIRGGDTWPVVLKSIIESAHIFVLLLSHHYLGSSFIIKNELRAIRRRVKQDRDNCHLYPIVVWPCSLGRLKWIKNCQYRPKGKPLWGYGKPREREWLTKIADEICEIAKRISSLSIPPQEMPPSRTKRVSESRTADKTKRRKCRSSSKMSPRGRISSQAKKSSSRKMMTSYLSRQGKYKWTHLL